MPPTKTYWKNGEVGSSSIQVETVESGKRMISGQGEQSSSSPATTVYSNNETTFLYAFYLNPEGAIYYWVQGALGDIQVNYEPDASNIPNPNSNNPAVAILGKNAT